MRTRKSAPTLIERQRRRQIIDLLAGHLVRMPFHHACILADDTRSARDPWDTSGSASEVEGALLR